MSALIELELQESKKKLDYYKGLKTRIETLPASAHASLKKKPSKAQVTPIESIEKWIEIYSGRVRSLERAAQKNAKRSQ